MNQIEEINLVKQMSELSLLSYESPVRITQRLHDRYSNFTFIEDKQTDTQCFLCEDEDYNYITPRGTTSLEDWKTNIACGFVYTDYGTFHKGFYEACNSVYERILCELDFNKGIIIQGHSLGGGIGGVCAYMLSQEYKLDALVTFGSPRYCSSDTPKLNCLYNIRVVNNNDIIVRLPPRVFGYKHQGKLYYFTEGGLLDFNISLWEAFLYRMGGVIDGIMEIELDSIADHPMAVYDGLFKDIIICA